MPIEAARTALACRVCNIDRQKLTDAIASGDYPCAPVTRSGKARVFEMHDLIALYTYARLVENGHPVRLAGRYACALSEHLRERPKDDFVRLAMDTSGRPTTFGNSQIDENETHISGLNLFAHLTFDLRNTRGMILAQLAADERIGGEDDGE